MPSLVKLYNKFKKDDFIVLAVNVQEKRETAEKYARGEKLPFPVLLDVDGKISYIYGIRAHPAHFLIDRQGKLIGQALGARDWASSASQNLIRYLLGQK